MPSILNIKHGAPSAEAIFIGRKPRGFHFGNPFSHLPRSLATVHVATRDEAIDRFRSWLKGETDHYVEPLRRDWILKHMERLRGRDLLCYCAPARCHGDVYLELLKCES